MERQGDTHSSSSKSTANGTHDTTSSLKESFQDGILYRRKQCVLHLSTLSKVIWQRYVTRRWAFSRIADPLSLKVNLGTTGLTNPVSNPVIKHCGNRSVKKHTLHLEMKPARCATGPRRHEPSGRLLVRQNIVLVSYTRYRDERCEMNGSDNDSDANTLRVGYLLV